MNDTLLSTLAKIITSNGVMVSFPVVIGTKYGLKKLLRMNERDQVPTKIKIVDSYHFACFFNRNISDMGISFVLMIKCAIDSRWIRKKNLAIFKPVACPTNQYPGPTDKIIAEKAICKSLVAFSFSKFSIIDSVVVNWNKPKYWMNTMYWIIDKKNTMENIMIKEFLLIGTPNIE